MDKILLIILAALAISLILFASGVIPYPVGFLVLLILAIARVMWTRGGSN